MPPDFINDDELIGVPFANLRPGELRRAFLVKAMDADKKQQSVSAQRALTALQGRQQDEESEREEEEHRAFVVREEHLLAAIREREIEIDREAKELDDRAIKLHDGRRAYVDGTGYRDAQGRVLKDADRAEAEQHHLSYPHAATWSEKQSIDEKREAAKALRRKVEKLQDDDAGPDQAKALSGLEKEFQTKARTTETAVPDYGDGDYMAALGLSANFKQAATSPGAPAPGDSTKPLPVVATPSAFTL